MPFYDHICHACQHEWEDFYSMVTDPPDTCPSCEKVGETQRLISDSFSVRVTLGAQEQKQKIREDSRKIKEGVAKDENLRANLAGEERYHDDQLHLSKTRKDLEQL